MLRRGQALTASNPEGIDRVRITALKRLARFVGQLFAVVDKGVSWRLRDRIE
jgi:hypothetical protein